MNKLELDVLSDYINEAISVVEIANKHGIATTTVYKIIQKFNEGERKPRPRYAMTAEDIENMNLSELDNQIAIDWWINKETFRQIMTTYGLDKETLSRAFNRIWQQRYRLYKTLDIDKK